MAEKTNEPSDDGIAKAIEEVLVLAAPSTSPATKALYILESIKAAGYVVTAEPATAPSVEQIKAVALSAYNASRTGSVPDLDAMAEAIHALYGTPGDADEPEWRQKYRAIRELEAELAEANEMRINLANRVTEVESIARAEVERHKAALEEQQVRLEALRKAEGYANPRGPFAALSATPEQRKGRALVEAAEWVVGDAARAAVEVETSEEADHG